MPALSWFWRITLLIITLMLIVSSVLGIDAGLSPDSPWSGQVEDVPIWLKIWLMWVLFPSFIASLLFVHRSNGARLAAAGFILSHIPMAYHMFDVTVGVVGIMHVVCWSPALYFLSKDRHMVELKTLYGMWIHVMLFVLAVSLTFDFRDALKFIFFY
jgi:hypothetical protein